MCLLNPRVVEGVESREGSKAQARACKRIELELTGLCRRRRQGRREPGWGFLRGDPGNGNETNKRDPGVKKVAGGGGEKTRPDQTEGKSTSKKKSSRGRERGRQKREACQFAVVAVNYATSKRRAFRLAAALCRLPSFSDMFSGQSIRDHQREQADELARRYWPNGLKSCPGKPVRISRFVCSLEPFLQLT